jgi:hypothetical protein
MPGITCFILVLQAIMMTFSSFSALKIGADDTRQTFVFAPNFLVT